MNSYNGGKMTIPLLLSLTLISVSFASCSDRELSDLDVGKLAVNSKAIISGADRNLETTDGYSAGIEIRAFKPDLVDSSLRKNNVAVIVIHGDASILKPEIVAKALSELQMNCELHSVKWDWSDPRRNNPFFDKLGGVHKDGVVLLLFSDGSERVFSVGQLKELREVLLQIKTQRL